MSADQDVCYLSGRPVSMCGLSWLQRTRPGVLLFRPRALREAARVHRVRVDCSASSSPEKAGKVTESLRHTGSDGRRVGFPTPSCGGLACPTPSCTFDNILPGRAQFQGGRGHLEALQCHGVDVVGRVSSLPGNLHVLRVNKGQKVFCHLRLDLGERHRCHQCRCFFLEK